LQELRLFAGRDLIWIIRAVNDSIRLAGLAKMVEKADIDFKIVETVRI
jgi:hypothetical protein